MTENKSNQQPAASHAECDGLNASPGDERLWRAWQYVSGELDPAERSAFEDLLAESQDAREAVAEAVEMDHLVRVAEAELTPREIAAGSLWSRRLSWMVMGAAASLLLAIGLRMAPSLMAPATTESPINSEQQAELALAWSMARVHMRYELAGEDGGILVGSDELLATADRELAEVGGAPTFLQSDPMSSFATPDWMMAALRAEAGDADPTTPEDGEEI